MFGHYFILALCVVAYCNKDVGWFNCKPKPGCSIARCDPRPASHWFGSDGLYNEYPILCQQNEDSSNTEMDNNFDEIRTKLTKLEGRLERNEAVELKMNLEIILLKKKNAEMERDNDIAKKEMKTEIILLEKKNGEMEWDNDLAKKEMKKEIDLLKKKNADIEMKFEKMEKDAEESKGKTEDAIKQIDLLKKKNADIKMKFKKMEKDAEESKGKTEDAIKLNVCALGMRNGKIPDRAIMTSSSSTGTSGKNWARMDQKPIDGTSTGAWCADANDRDKWIKIDLGQIKEISGVITQGSPSSNHWTTTYKVSCGDNNGRFTDVVEHGSVKIFTANRDKNTKAVNMFAEKINCRYLRIHPKAWVSHACVRLEILRGTCYSPNFYSFYVESAGMDDGNTCKVQINGVERAVRQRGHCVVAFNPISEAVTAKTFDTHASVTATNAMVSFINALPEYSVIAVAVRDATNPQYITDEASLLFQKLGAVGTDCGTKPAIRDSWAFITQKVRSGDPRPSWVKCQHVLRYNGKATVHATITTSAHYASWEDAPIA